MDLNQVKLIANLQIMGSLHAKPLAVQILHLQNNLPGKISDDVAVKFIRMVILLSNEFGEMAEGAIERLWRDLVGYSPEYEAAEIMNRIFRN